MNYWQKRARANKLKEIRLAEKGIDELKKLLLLNLKDVEKQIEQFYDKYGSNPFEQLTLFEVKKYKKELQNAVKKYKKDKTLKKILKEDAPKYKIDRLRALETSLQTNLAYITAKQEEGIRATLKNVAAFSNAQIAAQMAKQTGVVFNTINADLLNKIVNSTWVGNKNWSERLWDDREKLGKKVEKTLSKGIPQGKSLQEMSRELAGETHSSFDNAFRLIRTESAHIHAQCDLDQYKEAQEELGEKLKYTIDAFIDNRTSEICRELDNHSFWVDEAETGKNFPPLHPNCRTTTYLDI